MSQRETHFLQESTLHYVELLKKIASCDKIYELYCRFTGRAVYEMAGNSNLHDSARNKQDEFYTQLSLIESELKHYKVHFKGKTILCNCDDPFESNFFKYFAMNFNSLGLKKLIATCYATSPITGKELDFFQDAKGQLSFLPLPNADRKSTRLNSSHPTTSRMPSSA